MRICICSDMLLRELSFRYRLVRDLGGFFCETLSCSCISFAAIKSLWTVAVRICICSDMLLRELSFRYRLVRDLGGFNCLFAIDL